MKLTFVSACRSDTTGISLFITSYIKKYQTFSKQTLPKRGFLLPHTYVLLEKTLIYYTHMTQTQQDPIFTFDTTDPAIVSISLSKTGKDIVQENTQSVLEELGENIDQSLRGAGYMYNISIDEEASQIRITSFEGSDAFNQEVFDLIAEELQFSDNLLRDQEDEE